MYCIDRVYDEYVFLEDMDTGEVEKISISYFDKEICEGNLFKKRDEKFYFDKVATSIRQAYLKDLLDRLKNKK